MSKVRLMNSAMMPADGHYRKLVIPDDIFVREFKHYTEQEKYGWESYIGYPETARVLSALLGVDVPVSRAETVLDCGDVMLVARLKYRVNPADKATNRKQTVDDFEFSIVLFSEK